MTFTYRSVGIRESISQIIRLVFEIIIYTNEYQIYLLYKTIYTKNAILILLYCSAVTVYLNIIYLKIEF